MTPISEAEAVARYPELELLRSIRDAGWLFLQRLDRYGNLDGIDCWRHWPDGWRDGIAIRTSADACAIRMCFDQLVWDVADRLTDVVAELLALPEPNGQSAAGVALGATPVLWVP